jgi:hypothetical protein
MEDINEYTPLSGSIAKPPLIVRLIVGPRFSRQLTPSTILVHITRQSFSALWRSFSLALEQLHTFR